MRPTDNAVNVARCGMSCVRHQVGIPSGHFKAPVPQQLGNNGLTIAIFCQKAGKGVPKAVEHKSVSRSTGSFIQPHFLHNLIKDLADIVHDSIGLTGEQKRSRKSLHPFLQYLLYCLRHNGEATSSVFCQPDKNGIVVEVQVA